MRTPRVTVLLTRSADAGANAMNACSTHQLIGLLEAGSRPLHVTALTSVWGVVSMAGSSAHECPQVSRVARSRGEWEERPGEVSLQEWRRLV